MRIPFDSITLSAVVSELRGFVGSKLQRISQPEDSTVVLGMYGPNGEASILLSWDALFFRAHLVTKRPKNQPTPPHFCSVLRARLDQARLRAVEQVDFDRIMILTFEQPDAEYRLVGELMSKHANVALLDSEGKILAVGKAVGISKSVRPMLIGRSYVPPPVARRPSLLQAREGDDLTGFEGASPFLLKLLSSGYPGGVAAVQESVLEERFEPVLSPGSGAYPLPVATLGLEAFPRDSMSIALEQHYALAEPAYRLEQMRGSLLAQLNRVLISREAALSDLDQARDAASRAGQLQVQAELVLAYGPGLQAGASVLDAFDYDGNPIRIKLDPELGYLENANRIFEKAKKAKSGRGLVEDQMGRLGKERQELEATILKVERAERLEGLLDLQDEARKRHWLFPQQTASAKKEDRPYEGHRIRELVGPGGVAVLFGENATSNDYLTLRVAKPDDLWLHIRGSVSAHVVIRTERHPEKVGRELLMFAAKVAVLNSPSKHSGFVPVDYTLRKYVRKPRGSAPGATLYTHEKTVHVGE